MWKGLLLSQLLNPTNRTITIVQRNKICSKKVLKRKKKMGSKKEKWKM
jgi:hypothetical protein